MNRRLYRMFGLVLSMFLPQMAAAQLVPQQETSAVESARAAFSNGTFHYVGGDAERAALRDAIGRAVAPMNFIKRGIARGRLSDRNPVYSTLSFRFPPGMIAVSADGRAPFVSPDDGRAAAGRAITGDQIQITHHLRGRQIVEVLASNEGRRRNDFVLSPDGQTLTMRVTVESGQLPQPLRYQLTFRR